MIEVVFEFIIKEESRGLFELAYGPGGAWSKLFERCPGFRGTSVMCDMEDPRRYLTIELWDSTDQRDQARSEHKTAASDLDTTLSNWADSINKVGIFRVKAEATVRPRGRTRRSKAGKPHRRLRQTNR